MTHNDQIALFQNLLANRKDLDRRIKQQAKKCFPIGRFACWLHGKYLQTGEVVDYGYGLTMLVKNSGTGKIRRLITESNK